MHSPSNSHLSRCEDGKRTPSSNPDAVRLPLRSVATGTATPGWVEVTVSRNGTVPTQVLCRAEEVSPQFLDRLKADIPGLPSLDTTEGRGGVDIRLEDPIGKHVK